MTMRNARERSLFGLRWDNPSHRKLILLIGRGVLLLGAVAGLVWLTMSMIGEVPRDASGNLDFAAAMGSAKDSAMAPFLVMAIYVLLNFAGMPQFLLVGATVIVFGPWFGFFYAWGATMVSSSVGFWLGHFFGGELLRRFAGHRANEFSRKLGKHGILASALVRVLPAGPAIMVNMAAGVSHIHFGKFLIGTALGVAPKVFVIALVGDSLSSFVQSGNVMVLVLAAALVAAWAGFMIFAKKRFNRWRQDNLPETKLDDTDPPADVQDGGDVLKSETQEPWPADVSRAAKTGL